MNTTKQGILAAVASNTLFGVLYLYSKWLAPMGGTEVFAWRMVSMLVALWLILILGGGGRHLVVFVRNIGRNAKKWAWIVLPTPIIASQLWLFMWAPVNGYGIDVAIGYFLFPLSMALYGCCFFGEKLSRLQWVAIACSALGVAHELWQTRVFSWVTVWVFATYPIYYLLRRHHGVPALIGLLIDLTLIAPVAAVYLMIHGYWSEIFSQPSRYWLLIPLLGFISASAMQLNLHAGRLLSVPLFSMLSYLEPIFLFVLAVTVLHAPLSAQAATTYLLIWLGVVFSIIDIRQSNRTPS